MCAFFSKLLNVPTEPKATKFKDPIFLIGLMRSGTTLLMNTLSEHPQLLKAGFELNKVWSEVGGAPCTENCSERTEEDFSIEYANNMTAYFTKFIEESKSIKRHLARWSAKRFYGSGAIMYDWDNLYLMNKSPHLSNKIRYINKMYPNAKYVVIIRSLEGQVASMKMHFDKYHKQSGYNFYLPKNKVDCWTNIKGNTNTKFESDRIFPGNFNLLAEAWLRLNEKIIDDLKFVPNVQKHILSYEDLTLKQEEVLKGVFNFLDLKNSHKKTEDKIVKRERKIQNTTTKGNPLDKWKNYLSEEECQLLDDFRKNNSIKISDIDKFKIANLVANQNLTQP